VKALAAGGALKGTMTPARATAALARGIARAWPGARVLEHPVADGGPGTLQVAARAVGASFVEATVRDAHGAERRAAWLRMPDGSVLIESASACGAGSQPARPLRASSEGVADLLLSALERTAGPVRIGLGGSLSTDGGSGFLRALGAECLDGHGAPAGRGGGALADLRTVRLGGLCGPVRSAVGAGCLTALADVGNALLGPRGAARTYAAQKGAGPEEVDLLEQGLTVWAGLLEAASGRAARERPGAGAAGGLGFGLACGLGAALESGAAWILDAGGFDDLLGGCDLVLTCEGRFDGDAHPWKAPAAVLARAQAAGIPAAVLCAEASTAAGGNRVFAAGGPIDEEGLARLAEQAARTLLAGRVR